MPTKYQPQRNRTDEEVKLRYLPDSPETVIHSIRTIGYQDKLEKAVRDAMIRVKRR
ncbi:MAG: hypothetical protein Q8P12_01070 [bacterium]|nr:hypothetical protein [bacterium]